MIRLTGLAGELFEQIGRIPVVDCHEHLPLEADRVAKPMDVTQLFSHYCKADLEAAGLFTGREQDEVFDSTRPLEPRWKKLSQHLPAIRHGSYAWPAYAYVRDVLGLDDINDSNYRAISERLQADNTPGLYKRIMQDRCGIEQAIQCREGVERDQPFFAYLCRDRAWPLVRQQDLDALERTAGRSIHSLSDCVDALGLHLAAQKADGAIGMKVGVAYQRSLQIDNVPAADADRIFAKLRSSITVGLATDEMNALYDYLLRRQVEACIELGLVVVIHTGYQAGVRNDIRNARATHLWSLLHSYPRARFDLFHGSFPYPSDMTVLGKYFQNVSLNMCWMHIMSPTLSRRALAEWLDAVPATKIFAFGGDYLVVEKVYGHLQLARADVAAVLADKVAEGRMTEPQAIEVARLMLNENPKRWYRLGGIG